MFRRSRVFRDGSGHAPAGRKRTRGPSLISLMNGEVWIDHYERDYA
jgi:hypothetical protein